VLPEERVGYNIQCSRLGYVCTSMFRPLV
jgi:hypothetical protein